METLTSLRNPALKEIRKAIAHGSLTDEGFCVAEGFHLLHEALESGCEIGAVFATSAMTAKVEERLRKEESVRVAVLPDDVFQSIATTEASQGVIVLVKPPHWNLEDLFGRESPLLVMDGIQDPGNAGAMLRAAEAFMASGVAMLKGCVNPFNPKALRASAGSAFRVPLLTGLEEEALLRMVEERSLRLYALIPGAADTVTEARLGRSCAVVVGSEGHGVSAGIRKAAKALRIRTHGVESLNAAMAATVLLYESNRQLLGRATIR
jgi:TrmH family RNA methyltransferase